MDAQPRQRMRRLEVGEIGVAELHGPLERIERRLIGEASLAALEDRTETPTVPGDAYGIATIPTRTGHEALGDAHGHDGFFPGYLTSVACFPALDLALAVQTNTDDVRVVGGRLFDALLMPVAEAAVAPR